MIRVYFYTAQGYHENDSEPYDIGGFFESAADSAKDLAADFEKDATKSGLFSSVQPLSIALLFEVQP